MSKATFRASADSKAVAENMQILTGQKGDKLDKALTYREAAAIGLLKLRRSGSGAIIPENPTPPERDPVWQGVEKPHAPVNVTADGAFHTVTLTWDIPTYKGHAFAEVWRAEFDDAVADKGNNIAKAVRVGTTLANVYADAVGKGFKAFYWVRFVNKNGYNGPYQSALGLSAETSADVDEIIASATNFAIYNPAKPTEKEIIFGVTDDGKVAIREAVIKKATIQIIHSEKITADYIKAGVSISAPAISGGSFDMGNAYMSGGAAGFGKGGPYGGWGFGWHTIIYSDGGVYTNRLNAEGGNIRNMRIGNCVIEENCDVRGTLYANKIVGDVVRAAAIGTGASQYITMPADPLRGRTLIITGIELVGDGWDEYIGGSDGNYRPRDGWCRCNVTINGRAFSKTATARGEGNVSYRSFGVSMYIPVNTPVSVAISLSASNGWWETDGAMVMLI